MVQISPKFLHLLEPHNIELIPIIWNTSFNQPVKISIASFQLVPIYISIYSFVICENIEKISMFCVLIIAALVSFASAAPARPIWLQFLSASAILWSFAWSASSCYLNLYLLSAYKQKKKKVLHRNMCRIFFQKTTGKFLYFLSVTHFLRNFMHYWCKFRHSLRTLTDLLCNSF